MTPTVETPSDRRGARALDAASNATIRAQDIMTTNVVTVGPETTVRAIALLLDRKHISAVPVTEAGAILGIVSAGDLVRRQELGTARDPAHADDAKSRGKFARDVMTRDVVTVAEAASLVEVAKALEANRIRRVLVTRQAKLVGIVSRADIVHALAARPEGSLEPTSRDDDMIRYQVIEALMGMPGTSPWATSVVVSLGVVELRGGIEDEAMRAPSCKAVEAIPYVVAVKDLRTILQPY